MRGRTLATKESMSLVTSSAYTETWRTSYFFNTAAGVDTFFDVSPSSSARCCIRTTATPRSASRCATSASPRAPTARLRLEEKGTVYNEMVASMANGGWQAWRAQNHAVYGKRHTLSYNQGGEPAGIRTMTPEDIRRFHAATPSPRQHGHGGRVPEVGARSTTCWRASTGC